MNYIEELLKSLYVMASLVEARDPYTGGHLWRVSQLSGLLAASCGLPGRDVARITLSGFLHDLGKVGVPDAILNKHDRLTEHEYAIIKTHPEVGNRLLSGHPLAPLARDAVLHHHERPDGMGYPQGLKSESLSMDAKIVGITDAFDAMTSTRPYRRGMPIGKALAIIEEWSGRQFDASLSPVFVKLGKEGALDHIVGHSDLGIPMQDCPECGPIMVVRRNQESGTFVFCRNCGYKTTVIRENGRLTLADSEEHGTPEELQPELDMPLITELIAEAARVLG
jgi:HD-GYP domain-containing protein (c-di-GMP phosphodiesterase class II)